MALLQREKGKHFDPQLVDLFIAQLPAVLQIKERYAEDGSAELATTPPRRRPDASPGGRSLRTDG